MGIKTRTRNLVKYLTEQFGEKYAFCIENDDDNMRDIIHVGRRLIKSKLQSLNFEITVDYAKRQVRMFGIVVAGIEHLERMLGKVVRNKLPKWAQGFINIPKKFLKVSYKKRQAEKKYELEELRAFEFKL